ncbi:MAG: ABC transporter ATP-binding protein [Actinobacteria bacterium]|nr:ABC transporter ATP-binding protein [Actinomycetota bacterium]
MGSAAIECKNLTKYYGKSRGIDGLSLTVERGSTYGFLGPNGAGKTTTIRCLLGMLQATSGEAFVLGERVKLDGAGLRRRIGYVPGEVKLYEKETGRWHIDYISRFRGGPGSLTGELIERLAFDQGRRVRELSKGNRQKLALVLGLMHDPELLMLDEPTSGLDPLNQEVVFDIVSERVAAGATVFLSSHILSEVERVCTTVGIIKEGRLVAEDHVESLLRKRLRKLEVTFHEPVGAEALSDVPGVKDITILSPRKVAAKVEGEGIDRLLKRLSAYEVDDLVIEHESLEEAFVDYYRKEAVVGESEADLPDRRKEVDRT